MADQRQLTWKTARGDTVEVIYSGNVQDQWYWRVRAANNRFVAVGGEGYHNRQDAIDAAERYHPPMPDLSDPEIVNELPGTPDLSNLQTVIVNAETVAGQQFSMLLVPDEGQRLEMTYEVTHRGEIDLTPASDGLTGKLPAVIVHTFGVQIVGGTNASSD